MPPFVLQPLVENALRHGLAQRTELGRVEIGARRDGDVLILSVRDDGAGIDANGIDGDAGHREGVGLANTRERLATLYGGRAELRLAAMPTGGTMATVRLPFRRLAEEASVRA